MVLAPRIGSWIALVGRRRSGSSPACPRRATGSSGCCSPTRSRSASDRPAVRRRRRLLRLRVPVLALPARRRLHRGGAVAARRAGRALPLRRGAAAGRRRPDDHRRPGPPDHPGRGLRAAQGGRVLPGPAGAAARHNDGTDLYGAGYTDVNALLPAKEILAYISIVVAIAILVFSNAFMRNLVWPGLALGLLAISAVAIGGIYPAAVQTFTVKPSLPRQGGAVHPAQHRRRPATAFGLTDTQVDRRTRRATRRRRRRWPPTPPIVPNIRLLDPAVGLRDVHAAAAGPRLLRLRPEARHRPLHDRRASTQDYVVGVREINYGKLTAQQTQLAATGTPSSPTGTAWWRRPPTRWSAAASRTSSPASSAARGASSAGGESVLVDHRADPGRRSRGSTTASMADRLRDRRQAERRRHRRRVRPAAAGDQPATSTTPTTGTGGVPIGSFWPPAALRHASTARANFLLSDAFNENSKLLYVRDPRDRVEKVAPFLTLDGDPYPAVVDGRIVWILDGYTTSATYPYSQRIDLAERDQRRADHDAARSAQAQAERQLHAQLGEGHRRRVRRHGDAVLVRRQRTRCSRRGTRRSAASSSSRRRRSRRSWRRTSATRRTCSRCSATCSSRFHVTDPNEFFSAQDFWAGAERPGAAGRRRSSSRRTTC